MCLKVLWGLRRAVYIMEMAALVSGLHGPQLHYVLDHRIGFMDNHEVQLLFQAKNVRE